MLGLDDFLQALLHHARLERQTAAVLNPHLHTTRKSQLNVLHVDVFECRQALLDASGYSDSSHYTQPT